MPSKEELVDPLVFDTSVLFNLGHRGNLENLVTLLKENHALLVPPEAVEETQRSEERREYYQRFIQEHFTVRRGNVPAQHEEAIVKLAGRLGDGELAVIILALDTAGTPIIDEVVARKAVHDLGVQPVGTVGLLQYAAHKQWLTGQQVLNTIETLRKNGFRIRPVQKGQTLEHYVASIEKNNA